MGAALRIMRSQRIPQFDKTIVNLNEPEFRCVARFAAHSSSKNWL